MGYTALKPIAIVSIDREQEQGIPYQRRTRRAMRKRVCGQQGAQGHTDTHTAVYSNWLGWTDRIWIVAAMPPTRPDRQRAPTSSTTNNGSNATGSNAGGKAQPPRPPNAWILYRSDKLKELATQQTSGPRKPQAEISKIISQMWQQEGPDTKGKYETRAEEKKAEHAATRPCCARHSASKRRRSDRQSATARNARARHVPTMTTTTTMTMMVCAVCMSSVLS
ncbi:HMG (high mobility group) box domain-containing protein [Rhizoctonia solani AG-1 IA]|uniref:HMG (High mobility group) box domain-containing protein n=1 Tax=Thanatephorus cucumeris (strain AG1-IA) TaxID=983506 RepID=L8WCR3_THACA|nr:HMG (high mobility group) box domain-containing protein [Rhizoctonia solani AG-1 IA]